jgi:translation initiation factor 3 subunit B
LVNTHPLVWPVFQWSPESDYFGRLISDKMISVYESETMNLHEKKSIKIEAVKDFKWSPLPELSNSGKVKQSDLLLSYWTPENGNMPARVSVMRLADRSVIRNKNLFNVAKVCYS